MYPRFVVIPNPDQGDVARVREVSGDGVRPARREGGQPDVHIVLGPVHPVDEVGDHTGVLPIGWQNVDVGGVCLDVRNLYRLALGTEYFYSVKANVVPVPPSRLDVDDQVLSIRQDGDFKVALIVYVDGAAVLPFHGLWLLLLPDGQLLAVPAALLLLQELVQDVPLERHVGDAPPMGAVKGSEGVPRLVQCVLLLAVPPGPWQRPGPGIFWKKGHRMGEAPLVVRVEVGTLRDRLIQQLSAGCTRPQGNILETCEVAVSMTVDPAGT